MSKQKILVVEDEAIIAMELVRRLERSGFASLPYANSGEDAIKKANEFLPDLILMDIELGEGIDGIEAAERITSKIDVPIIYLTAYSDEKTVTRAKQTGPFGYLVKPFEQKDLETTIEVVLFKFETEKKLKASESWLDATLKNIDDGIIALNLEGIINFVNKVAEEILGAQREYLLGKTVKEIFRVHGYSIKDNYKSLSHDTLPEPLEEISNREMVLFRSNGSKIIIEISGTSIKDDRGNSTGSVLVFT
jgi:PAS domain S-box-containing protein